MAVSTIAIKRFWTEYVPAPTDTDPLAMRAIDWVEYGAVGSLDRSTTCSPVKKLLNVLPLMDRSDPAILAANERMDIIKRAYDAWKLGQETPVEGTPLAAWNGISREQADVLRTFSVRTVEEVASLTDSHLERIRIPALRELIKQAQRFLASADTTRYAQELAQRDRTISEQGQAMADQGEQIKALLAKVNQLAEMVAAKEDEGEETDGKGKRKKAA